MHRDKFRVNKTNRCTKFQLYWYYDSTCFGQPFRPSSGVLSRTSALVHCMQLWWPCATGSRMELQFHSAPGSIRSSQLHKMYKSRCTAKNSWWWAERLPETCRVVILINLEFSASVAFIHKESQKCCFTNTIMEHVLRHFNDEKLIFTEIGPWRKSEIQRTELRNIITFKYFHKSIWEHGYFWQGSFKGNYINSNPQCKCPFSSCIQFVVVKVK